MQIRCPHCKNPIEILDDASFSDIDCPSCGSGFSLVGDETIKVEGILGDSIGHFLLTEKLGVGGFGTVWKANDTKLDRTVAIKLPRKGQLDTDEAEQFLREARAVAQLKHPNIVSVHEVGKDNGQVYIVSDYVDGITLADWITGQQPMPNETAQLCRKITKALHHAHQQGVIHRDLKPSNIMLDRQGEPHIMDFGLAKREAGEITMTVDGKILGTPAYMSPEQARGEGHGADARSDIYSLGVILYELLTGEKPFRGNLRMLLHQVLNEEPKSPRTVNDRIPRELETITLKCMEKDPEKRYQTTLHLVEELTRYLNHEPIQARPTTQIQRLLKWARRHPTRAVLSVLLPLTLLLVIGLSIGYRVNDKLNSINSELNSANNQLSSSLVRTEKAEEAEKLANEKLQKELYFRHLTSAYAEYERNNLANARQYLEKCPVKYRNFEWNYYSRLCNQSLRSLLPANPENQRRLWGMAVSPDNRYIATVGQKQNGIMVWELATNKVVKSFGSTWITAASFSHDGSKIIGRSGKKVNVWDFQTGEKLVSVKVGSTNWDRRRVAVNQLGTIAVPHKERGLQLRNIEKGELLHDLKTILAVHDVAFSPNGKIIAAACQDWSVQLWNAITGKKITELRNHLRPVISVTISPDGKLLASGDNSSEIVIWNLATFKEIKRIQVSSDNIAALAFSPDSTRLASGVVNGLIELWDVKTGRLLRFFKGHETQVTGLEFVSNGRLLASTSLDRTLKLWDVNPAPEVIGEKQHAKLVWDVDINPKGNLIAVGRQQGEVPVFNLNTGRLLHSFPHKTGVSGVAFSPTENLLATAAYSGDIRIYDLDTGLLRHKLKGDANIAGSVVFTKDGTSLLSTSPKVLKNKSSKESTIYIWNVATGELSRRIIAKTGRMGGIQLNSDDSLVAGNIYDPFNHRIQIWNFKTGKLMHVIPSTRFMTNMAFDPAKNRLISNNRDQFTQFWDLATRKESREKMYFNSVPFGLAFHPNGNRVAIGFKDQKMRIYDYDSMDEAFYSHHHTGSVGALTFSRDGNILVSGSWDGTAKIIDARPNTPELHTKLEALSVLRFLTAQKLPKDETKKRIANDPTIGPEIRKIAYQFLDEFYVLRSSE